MTNSKANDVLLGAAAGIIATVPMTMVMEQLHRSMPEERETPLPPREVTEGVYARLAPDGDADEMDLERLTFLSHYAFGGSAGAMFALIAPAKMGPAIGSGAAYGLSVWTATYLAALPALRVRHHPRHDSVSRNGMMIAAHLIWGATLGLIIGARPGLRAASRHPDEDDRRSR
jgi:uncharacterized membrane protein YagU involved in acid resistance